MAVSVSSRDTVTFKVFLLDAANEVAATMADEKSPRRGGL